MPASRNPRATQWPKPKVSAAAREMANAGPHFAGAPEQQEPNPSTPYQPSGTGGGNESENEP